MAEMTSTETAAETRTIVYETHPDGSPAPEYPPPS